MEKQESIVCALEGDGLVLVDVHRSGRLEASSLSSMEHEKTPPKVKFLWGRQEVTPEGRNFRTSDGRLLRRID